MEPPLDSLMPSLRMKNLTSSRVADCKEDDEVHSMQFKIILLGDGAVGKTSIATRFADDQFSQNYKQTVGVDFFIRRLDIPPNYEVALQIWDIGGQSIGSKMITNYISGAHAILLCYDITNFESFANLEDWYGLVTRTFAGVKRPYLAIVGNKNDLRHMMTVRPELHLKFAEENEMSSFLLSAKSGDQIKQAFFKIAALLAGAPAGQPAHTLVSSVLPATIINHTRHDKDVNKGEVPDYIKPNNSRKQCTLS